MCESTSAPKTTLSVSASPKLIVPFTVKLRVIVTSRLKVASPATVTVSVNASPKVVLPLICTFPPRTALLTMVNCCAPTIFPAMLTSPVPKITG